MNDSKNVGLRRRMKREERRDILLDLATTIIEERGIEALTLITLTEVAGITKPVTYSQFQTRQGLLMALYQRCDARFFAELKQGMLSQPMDEHSLARRFTDTYLLCVKRHGRVYDATIAALKSYPEHETIAVSVRMAFICTLRNLLQDARLNIDIPSDIRLISLYGSIEELGKAYLDAQVPEKEAGDEMMYIVSRLLTGI